MGSIDRPSLGATDASDLDRLLAAIADGDKSALATLYRRTSAKLYGIALRVLCDQGAAEEVLQDVYVTVWNKASTFEAGRASAITWLSIIARNRAIDRKRRAVLPVMPVEAAAEIPTELPLASDIVEHREEVGRLRICLDDLDERARLFIQDAFLGGATYRELAVREDVPLGTMKSVIRRGLQRLRKCLEA